MNDRNAGDAERIGALAAKFKRTQRVIKLAGAVASGGIEDVASEAATGLVDVRRAAENLINELFPKLDTLAPESAQFEEALDDIAEELRHINYHIMSTRLFNYVVPRQ
jgi:hypothetical protein